MVTTALLLVLACGDDTTTGQDSGTTAGDSGTTGGPTDTGPFAGIAMEPTTLHLTTSNGEATTGSFTIQSTGAAALEITDISYSSGKGEDLPGVLVWMTQGPLPITIPAGSSSNLSIEWTPDRPGDTTPLEADLTVTSNSADDPTYVVQITGENSGS